MKTNILFIVALMLPIWVLSSCKADKQTAGVAETKSTVAAGKTQAPAADSTQAQEGSVAQEVADGEMEGQGGMYIPDDIAKYWKKRVISVPGQKSDIVALFEAFYKEWPTEEGNRIVHVTNPALAPSEENFEEGSIIDRKNGYVESAWYEGEDLGTISACVWNRKNGHKLFAVTFVRHAANGYLCCYDFDPDKRTLTPEESPVKREQLNYPDKSPLWYDLPQEGKTLTVVEDAPGDDVAITYYEFDGQNLKFDRHER